VHCAGSTLSQTDAEAFADRFLQSLKTTGIDEVFNRHASVSPKHGHKKILHPASLGPALEECGVELSADEVEVAFSQCDMNDDGGLDLEEFRLAAKTPTKLQQWADTLELPRLLARCLALRSRNPADPHRGVADLSPADLADALDVFGRGLRRALAGAQAELRTCLDAMRAAEAAAAGGTAKFQTFKMSSGKVEDFHGGVTGRVGESALHRRWLVLQQRLAAYSLYTSLISGIWFADHCMGGRPAAPRPREGDAG
jgi:hypothetical protein